MNSIIFQPLVEQLKYLSTLFSNESKNFPHFSKNMDFIDFRHQRIFRRHSRQLNTIRNLGVQKILTDNCG